MPFDNASTTPTSISTPPSSTTNDSHLFDLIDETVYDPDDLPVDATTAPPRTTSSGTNSTSAFSFNNLTASFRHFSTADHSADFDPNDNGAPMYTDSDRHVTYEDMSAIDWQYEYARERMRREKVEHTPGLYGKLIWFLDASHVWLVLIGTGAFVALIAAFTDIVSRWLADIKFGYCDNAFYLPRDFCCSGINANDECLKWVTWERAFHIENNVVGSYAMSYIFYTIFAILFATSACILVMSYSPHSRFSGIAEIKTILSGFIIRGMLGFKTLLIKSIGLILVVGAGLWVGKEGPLVHVACCCANIVMMAFPQLYHNEAKKREIFVAAASAGISVAFGSPIGGVLFSLEQLSYYFPERTLWTSFVAAMVAAVTLQFINPFRSGNLVLFQVVYDRLWHRFELVPFAFIGVIGGLYGALFNSFNIKIAVWRRRQALFVKYPIVEVVLVALVTGIVTYPSLYTRIPSSISLSHLFQECSDKVPGHLCDADYWLSDYFILTAAGIQGFFLTSYTFGMNIPAGIIMPSMLNGALLGRAIGILVNTWHVNHPEFFLFEACPPDGPCITPGVYALVGAASTLCGVTHLTVSTVVIMFELTGALTYVIPIMTGVMVSKWVSDSFNHKGIYESWIQFMEYPFLDNHDDQPIPDVTVERIMTKVEDLTIIPANGSATVGFLKELLETTQTRGFPITKTAEDMTLVGYIMRSELKKALDTVAFHAANSTPCTFASLHTRHHGKKKNKPYHDTSPASTVINDDDDVDSLFNYNDAEAAGSSHGNPAVAGSAGSPISLYQYAELSPITLSWESSLQLAASMFQKLGLRFILFTHKGMLKGLLTRKDVWQLLNSFETDTGNVDDLLNNEDGAGDSHRSHRAARERLLNAVSYSLHGSEDEMGLLSDDHSDSAEDEDFLFR